MEAVLPGAQHREIGRVRAEEIAGRMGGLRGARMSVTGPIRSPIERADPPPTTSAGGHAMITTITATLRQPVAGFGVLHSLVRRPA